MSASAVFGLAAGVACRVAVNRMCLTRSFAGLTEYYMHFKSKHQSMSLFNRIIFQLEPWKHVMCGSIGAFMGYNYSSCIESLNEKVNELKEERGHMVLIRRNIYPEKE